MSLKNNKYLRRLAAALMSGVMMASMMGMTAFAANTPVSGETVSIDKYLVLSSDAHVPNATFNFTIVPGTAVVGTVDNAITYPEIKAGIGNPTVSSVTFEPTDSKFDTVQAGDTVTLGKDESYAKETMTVDFTKVSFTEPGIYRYVITENDTTEPGITKDSKTRYLDVYVDSDENGVLSIRTTVLHDSNEHLPSTGGVYSAKTKGFQNTYTTKNLTLKKKVDGAQGNRNADFEFTVAITGADPGTVYNVLKGKGNSLTAQDDLTVGTDGTVSQTYTLIDGEQVVIEGLTGTTKYTITENDYTAQGYKTEYDFDEDTATGATVGRATSETTVDTHNFVLFTNTKNAVTPTGVIVNIAPYVAMVVLAAGLAFLFLRRRKRDF